MTEDENFLIQKQLPEFDQYFKHNDYIQNFELAAAMDITQHRVFDTLMSCVQTLKHHKHQYLFNNTSGRKTIKLNLDFFLKRYLKSQNIKSIKRSELKAAVKSLAQIVVIKDTSEGIRARPVFQEVFVNTKQNRLEIEISKFFSYDSLAPGKDTQSPGYTKLLNSNQYALKSIYARIFYQFFISKLVFKNQIEVIIEIKRLHRMLGLVNEEGRFLKGKSGYAETSQFKRRCIKEPLKVINDNTELELDVSDIKEGRKVVAFKFNAKFKSKNKKETFNTGENQLDIIRPEKSKFKSKDDFVVYMKIYYKNSKITNCIPGCPIQDYLVLDENGMLCLENKDIGIYRYSKNNKIDSEFAKRTWQWLFDNMDRVGMFTQLTKIDILNHKYKDSSFIIDEQKFNFDNLVKDSGNWIVNISNKDKTAKIKIPITEDIERYLESIKE